MNKAELINTLSSELETTKKDAEKVITTLLDIVINELEYGGKVSIAGFGTFEVVERAARTGRNPKTGESILIESSKSPKFKPAKSLKDAVNGR